MNLKTGMVAGVALLAVGTSAQAALLGRVPLTPGGTDYQAYYDTALDITWVADANLAQTSGYDSDGWMSWYKAQAWIGSLNSTSYLGVNDWRLPVTAQPDASCTAQDSFGSYGFLCTGSEMGHLTVDGVFYDTPYPFSHIQYYRYWSGTSVASDDSYAWYFRFVDTGLLGTQGYHYKDYYHRNFAWAVRDGDLAAVPVPAAGWLFASALGLLGWRRKARTA